MVQPIKVYLDSSVIMRLLFEKNQDVKAIVKASKKRIVETYVSWLSLMEISKSASIMAEHGRFLEVMKEVLDKNQIKILAEFDSTLSSGSILPRMGRFDYSDYMHLQIAKGINANYFVTYDRELLSKKLFENLKIVDPGDFVKQVLT